MTGHSVVTLCGHINSFHPTLQTRRVTAAHLSHRDQPDRKMGADRIHSLFFCLTFFCPAPETMIKTDSHDGGRPPILLEDVELG
jgi:hypothetical protein